MRQNVVVSEFENEANAYEAFHRIQKETSTNGYEIYQAAVVTNDGTAPKIQEKIMTGLLTRSHILSDCALGAILGLLFGFHGLLIGALAGLINGTLYDTAQRAHDARLLQQASSTVQEGMPALIVIANEKYEDALDQKLYPCQASIHRAYCADLREQQHADHFAGI